MSLPRFEPLTRLRPLSLLAGTEVTAYGEDSLLSCPQPAPSAAAVATGVAAPLTLWWSSGNDRLAATWAEGVVTLEVTTRGRTRTHRSRRHGRTGEADAFALTLTGTHLTAFTGVDGAWTARGRVDLADVVDTRDESWLTALHVGHHGRVARLEAGGFGQLGLRDLRLVSHADGSPYRLDDDRVLLTATSAGPGFFDTAHTSVWSLDPVTLALEHRSDLFFRRPDRPGVYGDHATHLVRDGERWLVATSTWGDFESSRRGAAVGVTLACSEGSEADLLRGRHVLDTEPLALPTDGFRSVGVWDPHLVRTEEGWLVGYVSARRFFRFHPVLAAGPRLDALRLRGVDRRRRATEGTTLLRVDGAWRVLASDGRDGRRGQRERYPVFDLDLHETGALTAPYPTNIPWPTLLPLEEGGWLLIGFNGKRVGGSLLGYGTHGEVVIARSVS